MDMKMQRVIYLRRDTTLKKYRGHSMTREDKIMFVYLFVILILTGVLSSLVPIGW